MLRYSKRNFFKRVISAPLKLRKFISALSFSNQSMQPYFVQEITFPFVRTVVSKKHIMLDRQNEALINQFFYDVILQNLHVTVMFKAVKSFKESS